ncbi:hypothetical protein [Flavobacterium sp. SLB02]|uniref:hypothetical protein n=1 Tax=Flavobacterium sp. SLB02 TaxID=2665645 RepID=UPI0012A8F7A8|nr:hypothetical protein [Flavobacterium sp. SLB02]QGK73202.1 hypothetical protein GIY83_03725 [Flavobacterium sp. SLB02]
MSLFSFLNFKSYPTRIAVSLRRLLKSIGEDPVTQSYNKIALTAYIRKATVSDTFNARSIPNSLTLFLIVETMGFSFTDFAKIYDSIENSDLVIFKNTLLR